nr:immunoglobulin heavy chain junction region [Macaca mulatta]
CTTQGGFSGW